MSVSRPSDDRPTNAAVLEFLHAHHGAEATDLEPLGGGYWSTAYGYRRGDEELVLRLNDGPDGFRADEAAMAHRSSRLPVPEVLAIGEGLGRWFAVSRRHHGRFLEEVPTTEAEALAPTVVDLLDALRTTSPSTATDDRRGIDTEPWRDWLLAGLIDDADGEADGHNAGWRHLVAAHPDADRTFTAAEARVRALLDACVDRRQLVHGDLLHANVLVSPTADAVTAVFSWKCATWGDALYDLAWCTFWGRWHPGIAALDLWERVVPALTGDDATDVAVRHHAYELQIAASHLGWFATIDDVDMLAWTAGQLDELLDAGPRR